MIWMEMYGAYCKIPMHMYNRDIDSRIHIGQRSATL